MKDQYLLRSHLTEACQNMKRFYDGLSSYYSSFGLDLESNRGRRNILMSEPMEYFLAEELKKTNERVFADGRSGKADIIILNGENETELECKLTSPHESSGSICFQTDFETLEKKGSLDYIYIIANEDFSGFCAIYFKGLTIDDFRPLSPGARGKVQMIKHHGMKKANVLIGEAIDLNQRSIQKLVDYQNSYEGETLNKIADYNKKLDILRETQIYDRNRIAEVVLNLKNDLSERINKFEKEIIIKKNRKSRYTFRFETLEN